MQVGLGLGLSRGRRRRFDFDASTYITAVETADGQSLEPGVKTAINDFIVGCKTDGIWDAIKASCILAGARTLNGCLVPLTGDAPTNFNFVSADYNRKTGLKGDGATKYLDSNISSDEMPQNDIHFSVYVSDSGTEGTNRAHISTSQTGLDLNDIYCFTDNNLYSRNRTGASDGLGESTSETTGFIISNRSVSDSYIVRFGGLNRTVISNSDEPQNKVFHVFNRPGASRYSDARIALYSVGASVDETSLNFRVDTLMTAIDGAIT